MNKKIIEIASLMFALIFVILYLFLWSSTQHIIGDEVADLNSIYMSELSFDASLFDNKIVTGESLKNIGLEMASTSYSGASRLYFYEHVADEDVLVGDISDYNNLDNYRNLVEGQLSQKVINNTGAKNTYRTTLHRNVSGVIDGITFEKIV